MNLNKALLIAVAVLAPLHALASLQAPWIEGNCPAGVFETDPDKIAATFASETAEPMLLTPRAGESMTPEISRIEEGAVGNFVGAFINDGMETWWGYDASRHLFVQVEGTVVPNHGVVGGAAIPDRKRLGPNQVLRKAGKWTYYVTVVRATQEQALEFACMANELLSWVPLHGEDPESEAGKDAEAEAGKIVLLPAPGSSWEVTIIGRQRQRCQTSEPTDTFAHSFGVATKKPRPRDESPKYCDCRCQAAAETASDRLSSWISKGLQEPLERVLGTWNSASVASLAIDQADNLYLLIDPGSRRTRRIDILQVAPSGVVTRRSARVRDEFYPWSLALDRQGNALVLAGKEFDTVLYQVEAGSAENVWAKEKAVKGGLKRQFGGYIAFAADDTLYAAINGDILKIAPNGDSVRLAANLPGICGFALAPNDDVFVADHTTDVVLKVAQDGGVSTFAGKATKPRPNDYYTQANGIALDRQGNLYVADPNSHVLRRITPSGHVSTLAGEAGVAGKADGRGWLARFEGPSSQIVVDSTGTVYVIDAANRLRKTSSQGRVSTIDAQPWLDQFDIDRQ
jgi:hypothetical protein